MVDPVGSVMSQSLRRRGSMFDGSAARLAPVGSSICTFGEDPNTTSDIFATRKVHTKYQNTYKTEPDDRFRSGKVQSIAEQVLMDNLDDVEYNISECRQLSKSISDKILQAVKNLGYNRHKIVVLVNIGQLNNQGIRIGSRCLWDDKRDNWAGAFYEGKTIWATATIYGVYYE